MTHGKRNGTGGKRFTPLLGLVLALSLTACGGIKREDTNTAVNIWDILTDRELSADITTWQGDDGSQLMLDISAGSYTYRTWYGRIGMGDLFQDDCGLGLVFCELDSDHCYYLVREGGGFTVRHTGGESGEYGEMNGLHFEPSQNEMAPYDISLLNGVWQNALGETLAFDTEEMRVIDCFTDGTMSSSRLYESVEGRGPFIGGPEVLYPCLSADGSSFVLFSDRNAPRDVRAASTGVFYRDGSMALYADPENACFEESDGRIWYFDGVNRFALPNGYTLGKDGQARDEYGRRFAPEWPETPYDPAVAWGEDWLAENW